METCGFLENSSHGGATAREVGRLRGAMISVNFLELGALTRPGPAFTPKKKTKFRPRILSVRCDTHTLPFPVFSARGREARAVLVPEGLTFLSTLC